MTLIDFQQQLSTEMEVRKKIRKIEKFTFHPNSLATFRKSIEELSGHPNGQDAFSIYLLSNTTSNHMIT